MSLINTRCFAYQISISFSFTSKDEFSQKSGKKELGSNNHENKGDVKPWIICNKDVG